MAIGSLNAFVGSIPVDGGVFYGADLDAPDPTDVSTDLPDDFADHGAIGPDGFTLAPQRTSSTEKKMGGGDFIDLQTEKGMEVTIVLLEDDNDAVLETVFAGHNVVKTPPTEESGTKRTIYHTVEQLPLRKYVLNAVYGGKKKRYGIPLGRVTNVAEIQNVHSASTKYALTIRCFESSDPAHQGALVVEYRDDGAVAVDTGNGGDPEGP